MAKNRNNMVPMPGAEKKEQKTVKQIRAEHLGETSSLVLMLPAIVFSAIAILLVRYRYYYMPMSQFSWTSWTDDYQFDDFFAKIKSEVLIACAVVAVIMLIYKFTVAELAIKRTWLYLPVGVYALFVVLSYVFSDYKEFALWGWTGRFEGTIILLVYMVMLLFIINTVNGEKNVKQILWPVAAVSVLLGMLGITQLLDKDFFKTPIGQKMLVPNVLLDNGYMYWELIDAQAAKGELALNFTMPAGTVYQTVFNINYVSFYLALLIPIFTMLFIRAMNKESGEPLWKKIGLGALLVLMVINDLGSRSSAGYVGLAVAMLFAVVMLNKRLIKMLKPLLIVIVLFAVVMVGTAGKWLPEIKNALTEAKNPSASSDFTFDYIETDGLEINLSLNGEPLTVGLAVEDNAIMGLYVHDQNGSDLKLIPGVEDNVNTFAFEDERFAPYLSVAYGKNADYLQIDLRVGKMDYPFLFGGDALYYVTPFGRVTKLEKVEHVGFERNPHFGTNRGYIWSRSIPLLKKNLIIGSGADTFCAVFPQNDIAGRLTTNCFTDSTIVDKPHNMYLGAGINTGCISLLALLTLYFGYIVQTVKLLWKRDYGTDYLTYVAAGILFGVIGFMVGGLADDSSVCTMPMFYTMLGVGIAVNMLLKKEGNND